MNDVSAKDDIVYTTFHNGVQWVVIPLDGMPKFNGMIEAMEGCETVDAPFQAVEHISKLEKKMDVLFQSAGLWSPARLRLVKAWLEFAELDGVKASEDVVSDVELLAQKFEELEKLK